MAKSAILRPVAGDRLRNGLTRLSKSAWLARNPRTALEIAQLFASPALRPVLRVEPRLMFKFLQDYVTTDLSRHERAAMLIHHYRFLKERVGDDFFQWIVDDRRELCRLDTGGQPYRIWLSFPATPYPEGDLLLIFEVDRVDLYHLSFTIGPAAIAGVGDGSAMYIPRVQGRGKGLDQIRQATRDCGDVSPAALLLAAAEGIAQSLGIEHLIGIGSSMHVVIPKTGPLSNLIKAYDEFWRSLGGTPLTRQMYHLRIPVVSKSILAVKREHRSRTHRKRRFKTSVKEQVCENFRRAALRPGVRPGER